MITMQNKRRGAALVASAAAMGVFLAGCNTGGGAGGDASSKGAPTLTGTDAVATVNGEAITQAEFYSQLQRYTPNPQQMSSAPAGKTVLQQLIMNTLTEQLAKQEGVPPTDAQINEQMANFKSSADKVLVRGFDDTLATAGLTEEDLKTFQIKPQLAQINLLTKGVTIADADIQAFYDLHKKDQFTKPNRAHIKRIALATAADANSVYDDIQKGKPFEDYVAKSVIKQPVDGDLTQWVNLDDATNPMVKPLVTAITAAKIGDVPKPIPLQGAWWLVKVVDKKPLEIVPVDQVKSSIKYMLLSQKAQQNAAGQQEMEQKLRDFQSKATISIVPKQYNDLIAEIKSPPPPMAPPGMNLAPPSAPTGPRPGASAPMTAPSAPAPQAAH
ncbi:MAG: peptidyl-prolyl cis-trans isomerase [Capsulimonas sp.]|uniref:peptidyl-prolyl cis-trans isomerase n=1 Tax=Capsulimonas sp. TaxID=2494211 RepID=UPI0032640BF6